MPFVTTMVPSTLLLNAGYLYTGTPIPKRVEKVPWAFLLLLRPQNPQSLIRSSETVALPGMQFASGPYCKEWFTKNLGLATHYPRSFSDRISGRPTNVGGALFGSDIHLVNSLQTLSPCSQNPETPNHKALNPLHPTTYSPKP